MYKNILLPVVADGLHDTQASFLVARALADENAQFVVVHVLEDIPTYAMVGLDSDMLNTSRDKAERDLKSLAAALPGARTALLSGNAGREIVDFAADNNIDCIVMASHQPGLEDYFLGSTAARVVRHAKCSVHVIR